MKYLILPLILASLTAQAKASQADTGGSTGSDPKFTALPQGLEGTRGTGRGAFQGGPQGQDNQRQLDLSDLDQESRGQCSFDITTTSAARAAESAINQIIEQCAPRTNPPTESPMLAISQAFGDAARDPLSCANYEATYDRMFRRAMSHPQYVSNEFRMCVSQRDGSSQADENCLFRTVSRMKQQRALECRTNEINEGREAQVRAIQEGVQQLDSILSGIISDNSSTCPDVDDAGKARILQTIVGTASQLLSIPLAGTGADLGIGLLANGLSRIFATRDTGLNQIRSRILNLENFSNLACLHENLQKEVSQCSQANARFENTPAEASLRILEGSLCSSAFGSISPNLEEFLVSLRNLRLSSQPQGQAERPCGQNRQSCVSDLLRNLAEQDGSGESLAQLILSTGEENKIKLQARLQALNDLDESTANERSNLIADLAQAGDPIFQQIAGLRGRTNDQNDLIRQFKLSTQQSLASVDASIGFLREICQNNCAQNLERSSRREILQDQGRVDSIVRAIESTTEDPIAAINSSFMLRTDLGLHGQPDSSLAFMAHQFTVSQRIRSQHHIISRLRTQMTPPTGPTADSGRRKSIELLSALSESMIDKGRNSLVVQQMTSLDRSIRQLVSTPRSCVGSDAGSANCESSRLSMFESDVKSLFMICQQLQSLRSVGGGQSTPSHSHCQRFNCAFEQITPQVPAPGPSLNFNNPDHNNFVCSNFNKKNERLQMLRSNFVRTGQVCPGSN